MRNFIGRTESQHYLSQLWKSKKSSIIALYGRRRVGKTALIHHFAKAKQAFLFEAIEGADTAKQIQHFLHQLSDMVGDPYIRDLNYEHWEQALDLLTQKISLEKSLLLAFDELAWMAMGRAHLVSLIKFYWDKHWKQHPHLLIILCGSVASWMLKNVVRSNALYGRLSANILLQPLLPGEVAEYIGNKRGRQEVLKYLICFGGIPKYLEEFDYKDSFEINIEQKCFSAGGFFVDEADKIFYNQFKETRVYQVIARFLLEKSATLQEVSLHLKMSSSGGIKNYLDNLIAAGILQALPVIQDFKLMKKFRYVVGDEFLRFHYQYIKPHLLEIGQSSRSQGRFAKFTQPSWNTYLGFALERFCLKYRYEIASQLGFLEKVLAAGSVLNQKKNGYQFDLVYLRKDNTMSLCEIKYSHKAMGTEVIAEFEGKMKKCNFKEDISIEKILITNMAPSEPLLVSGYFHQIYNVCDLLSP